MRKVLMLAVSSLCIAASATAQQTPVKEVKTSRAGKVKTNAKAPGHTAMVLKPAPKAAH